VQKQVGSQQFMQAGGWPMSDVDLRKLFSKRADSLPEDAELEISAVEAVRQCLPAIRKAKKKKMTWETVATIVRDIVQESLGVELRLTGNTVRYYYYQLTRKKKRSDSTAVPSKPRLPSTSTTSRKSSAPAPVKASAQTAQPSAPAVPPATTPTPEPVARSPAAEPRPESEVVPVVGEPVTPETSQAASTEELHPNRFRDRFKQVKNPKTTTGYENCKTL